MVSSNIYFLQVFNLHDYTDQLIYLSFLGINTALMVPMIKLAKFKKS